MCYTHKLFSLLHWIEWYSSYCNSKESNDYKDLYEKYVLTAKAEQLEEHGNPCDGDAGNGLVVQAKDFQNDGQYVLIGILHIFIKKPSEAKWWLGVASKILTLEEKFYWPPDYCKSKKEPTLFVNVGSYATEIWNQIKQDGGDECQEAKRI